jgi:bifunctional non-homologous end joining protein LigD
LLNPTEKVRLVDSFPEDGETLFAAFNAYGLEGIVGKRRDSIYEPGRRTKSWIKIKGVTADDFVVVGYTKGGGARESTFGALVIASHEAGADGDVAGPAGKLKIVGQVGSGFNDRQLKELKARLDSMVVDKPPVDEVPGASSSPYGRPANGPTVWVRPELVVEVKFTQWTDDGHLRAPVFMRVRDDKAPAEAIRAEPVQVSAPVDTGHTVYEPIVQDILDRLDGKKEEATVHIEGHTIKLTHLNKVLWPPTETHDGITKRDFVRYLASVSSLMLPHLEDRPLTLVRCPDGLVGQRFYQKHIDLGTPGFVGKVRLFSEHNIGDGDYILCNNLATLMWLGQIAALEMHPWYSRVNPDPDGFHLTTEFAGSIEAIDGSLLNYPDFVVFDLDPYIYSGLEKQGEEPELNRIAYLKTCDVAYWLKEILDQLGLTAFVKTTGKTGLHVFVPILRQIDYDTARSACETIGRFLVSQHPEDITMEWNVPKRAGKIFFDHNQNVRGKTLAAAYSPRLSPQGSVSLTVRWDELKDIYPTDFTILNAAALAHERGDIWVNILDAKSDIHGLLGMVE